MGLNEFFFVTLYLLLKRGQCEALVLIPKLAEALGSDFDLQNLEVAKKYSVGVEGIDGRIQSLSAWLHENEVGDIEPLALGTVNKSGTIPDHMMAGFEGTRLNGFRITTSKETFLCGLQSYRSLNYALSPENFIALFKKLERPGLRDRLVQEMNELFEMNQRPTIDCSQFESHLLSPEGRWIFEANIRNIIQEIQGFYQGKGEPLEIPSDFQEYFETLENKKNPLFGEEVYLNSDSPKDWKFLIDSQVHSEKIYQEILEDSCLAESLNVKSVAEIQAVLASTDGELFQRVPVGNLMDVIFDVCQEQTAQPPVYPDSLRSKIYKNGFPIDQGPPADFVPRERRLQLKPNPNPFEVYFLWRLGQEWEPVPMVAPQLALQELKKALESIHSFAEKIQSGFSEAFKLALFILESKDIQLEGLTKQSLEQILEVLRKNGFSEIAQNAIARKSFFFEVLSIFDPSEKQLRGLLASAVSDVFGGMGSWNDQGGFSQPEDETTYQETSAALYASLRNALIASLLLDGKKVHPFSKRVIQVLMKVQNLLSK